MPSTYGLLSKTDIRNLQACLSDILVRRNTGSTINVLEIGVWNGSTAKGIRGFLKDQGYPISYCGIENGNGAESITEPPFGGARIIFGDSISARAKIDDWARFDLLIIDGCHCLTHACMDFLCYQSLVTIGGYALFHDINPDFQGVTQHHASQDHKSMPMEVAVVHAINLLGLPEGRFYGWTGKMSDFEKGCSNGFFIAQKLTA
jgi:hypothetical protein